MLEGSNVSSRFQFPMDHFRLHLHDPPNDTDRFKKLEIRRSDGTVWEVLSTTVKALSMRSEFLSELIHEASVYNSLLDLQRQQISPTLLYDGELRGFRYGIIMSLTGCDLSQLDKTLKISLSHL